ncbi:hypothetical protein R1flu_026950 [Riccia fluitans]|uniref:Uncharacterized protein n=1 Tax=Riccia fluitans TaxID=41844 RepID=A0ABD1XHD5_9MARC
MGRPLSEVLAPGYEVFIERYDLLEDGRRAKRTRRNFEKEFGGVRQGSISMEERMREIARILQISYDTIDDEDEMEKLYPELYHHLEHVSALDFTNKDWINVFTLGMALQIGPLPKLEIVEIGTQVETEEEMESLADAIGMGNLPNLKFFNCSEIHFDDRDQVGIKALSRAMCAGFNCAALEQLHLVENEIRDDGIVALSMAITSGHLPSLKHLNLLYNHIGVEGAKALAVALESGHLPNLLELELSRNHIRDEGAEALAKAFASGKLRGLDTFGVWLNDIETKGAIAIARALESGNLPALRDIGILDFDEEGTNAIVRSFSSGHARTLEKVHFEHIDKQTAIFLARNVLESGHLPDLEELRLTSTSDVETVQAFILAYQNNRLLVADLQVDWDSAPEVQVLEDEFNRVRDRNLRLTRDFRFNPSLIP